MIEEKEIRIGNWFHYDPIQWNYAAHSGDFKWSSSDWFALGESTLFLEDITPIPLTGKWLDKFKFRKYNNIRFEHDMLPGDIVKGDVFYLANVVPEMKWVHQLQNAFYAITGEELEVK